MEFPCDKCLNNNYTYCEECDEVELYEIWADRQRIKETKSIKLQKVKYKKEGEFTNVICE